VPAPLKPEGQRRRTNRVAGSTVLPRAGRPGVAPRLPRRAPGGGAWHAATRAWWRAIWGSPMATVWLDADRFVLQRLAGVVDQAHHGVATAALLTEIRSVEDRFGLSPLSRQRLRWTIAGGEAPAVDRTRLDEDGRWLRAVTDG
jgi:hypothetical protein